ncbi:hypothetical protein [Ideonella sp. A 288]|uniref:hypothetical protein n=1 Tax=Ideonella sp. A 288 TaxID=1962181 RepID=UPI0018FED344|nr:hypothetical protein [Ideonella sp. A 288]
MAKASYALPRATGQAPIWLNGAVEFKHFGYRDFTDLRTGSSYAHNATLLQLYVSSTF